MLTRNRQVRPKRRSIASKISRSEGRVLDGKVVLVKISESSSRPCGMLLSHVMRGIVESHGQATAVRLNKCAAVTKQVSVDLHGPSLS